MGWGGSGAHYKYSTPRQQKINDLMTWSAILIIFSVLIFYLTNINFYLLTGVDFILFIVLCWQYSKPLKAEKDVKRLTPDGEGTKE